MSRRRRFSQVKFHYNFNMRDLSAVFQGLCSIHHSHVREGLKVARLWMHECERVYADRLISNTEIQRCVEIIVDVAKRVIDDDQEALFKQPNAWTTFATQTMDDSRACDSRACRGAFTSLKRVVSWRRGRGWFYFRI